MSQLSHDASVVVSATGVSFGSVCSGIEAASVAWEPMGWKAAWFAEIEAFPSAVLAHHWPQVQNLGDMTKIRDRITADEIQAPDVLVGGTPCQAFSVAGARKSLDDDRGQLTLEYVRLLNEIDTARSIRGEHPAVAVWENVPGVLSTKDNAFGCFLGALAGEECELQPTGKKWTNAGCVFGPQRTVAWRILDAQYFGVAQRRRRVFVVASAREGFNPTEVLFECEGVRRDTPPSRSAGQDTTRSIGNSTESSSYWNGKQPAGTLTKCGMNQLMPDKNNAQPVVSYAKGGELCDTITKKWAKGSGGPSGSETGNLVIHGTQDPIIQDNQAFPLGRNNGQENAVLAFTVRDAATDVTKDLAPTMRSLSKNKDGNLNGSHGLGVLVGTAFSLQGNMVDRESKQNGSGISEECAHTLNTQDRHAVAVTIASKQQAMTCEDDLASTLGANDHKEPQAVVDCAGTLTLGSDARGVDSDQITNGSCAINNSQVRRLTPIECERLQGFPDNHTQIPYRNKSADLCPDGPRYAACGNSMAVPVMAWIGKRIEDALNELKTNDNRKTPATANS